MDTYASIDDRDLARLRMEFPGHRIWRSVHSDGRLDGWVASLHDPTAGVEPLVICASAGELRTALAAERRRAEQKWREREEMDPVVAAGPEPVPPPPAADGAASVTPGAAASTGEAEMARPAPVPPGAPAALPWLIRWRMCVHLNRLGDELRRVGWSTELREGRIPPSLWVHAGAAPSGARSVGEGVVVMAGPGSALWYASPSGLLFGSCADVGGAAWEISIALTPKVAAALTATTISGGAR
jgi:hypothetical protein